VQKRRRARFGSCSAVAARVAPQRRRGDRAPPWAPQWWADCRTLSAARPTITSPPKTSVRSTSNSATCARTNAAAKSLERRHSVLVLEDCDRGDRAVAGVDRLVVDEAGLRGDPVGEPYIGQVHGVVHRACSHLIAPDVGVHTVLSLSSVSMRASQWPAWRAVTAWRLLPGRGEAAGQSFQGGPTAAPRGCKAWRECEQSWYAT